MQDRSPRVEDVASPWLQQASRNAASFREDEKNAVVGALLKIPPLVIGCILNLMICVPFGLSFFPPEWEPLPVPRTLGIQMFLLSTAISQVHPKGAQVHAIQ